MEKKPGFRYSGGEVMMMSAKMEVKNGNFQITIPVKEAYENRPVRNLLDILRGQDMLSHSKATEEQIRELADEVTLAWWEENRDKFLNGNSD